MTAVTPPAYRRVVAASGLSNLADGIRMAAFPLLAASLTDSATLVALVFAAGEAPWIVFGIWAGNLTDRVDRRLLVQRVALVRVLLLIGLAALILSGLVPILLVLVAAFVLGVSEVLADNASGALIPSLVESDQLERANSRMVGVRIAGNELVGPAIGGALFAIGASLPFFTNAGLLAFAFVLLAGLPLLQQTSNEGTSNQGTGDQPDADNQRDAGTPGEAEPRAIDGVAFLRRTPLLRTVAGAGALLAAVDGAWFALLVLFVRDQLGFGAAAFGVFLAIGAVGGLAGAALADRRPRTSLRLIALGVYGSMAVSLVTLGLAPTSVVLAAVLVVTSGGFALWNVFMTSARQRATPLGMLGRVGAAHQTIVVLASLLGAVLGGVLADIVSLPATLVAYGVVVALATPVVVACFDRTADPGSSPSPRLD